MLIQILDIDYFLNGSKPVLRIFGKTENNKTICCFYDKFLPYFYVRKTDENIKKVEELGLNYVLEKKFLPVGYSEEPTSVIKILLNDPKSVPAAREMFNESFDSDVLFKYRFMVDMDLKGMCWYEFEGIPVKTHLSKVPTYEIKSIHPVERPGNAELRFMCLDIECLQIDFSRQIDSKKDSIIMIALSFFPNYKDHDKIVLVSKPFSGKNSVSHADEKEMLEEFLKIIEEYDPDVVTGYNIMSFDLPHILDRLKKYDLSPSIGRSDKAVFSRPAQITGKSDNRLQVQDITIPGRIVFDSYQILKRDVNIRLHRYDLGTVVRELIGEKKGDVKFQEIPTLWKNDVQKLVDYAERDAVISLKLVLEKRLMDKFVEISKLSGVLLQDSFGGQTVRIETLVMHEFKKRNMIMPLKPNKQLLDKRAEEKLKGATVLDPEKGLHRTCTLVLDFQSLYPSIIKVYNVSPDSLVFGETGVKCNTSPTGARFVSGEVYNGVFPTIIRELVDTRQRVKKLMKQAEGEEKMVLDAKQHAIKILANSMYGYCGYIRARLYTHEVASSITAYGRSNIEKTKKIVEANFSAKVIYGDTDSLFLKTDITDMEVAKELGENISKFASKGELVFEFEKIYKAFLIIAKKRYAGWKFVKSDKGWEEKIEMKGIETVRRDWCPLVTEAMNNVINIMLKEGDTKKATDLVKKILQDLLEGRAPLEKLIIIKGITKSLESYDGTLPHIELAKKMKIRNPRDPPKVGERIEYIITRGKDLLSKRAEHPEYVAKYNIPIDSEYYINNQVLPPIERILSSVGVERSELFGGGKQVNLMTMFTAKTSPVTICSSCGKIHRRLPLSMVCDCGASVALRT